VSGTASASTHLPTTQPYPVVARSHLAASYARARRKLFGRFRLDDQSDAAVVHLARLCPESPMRFVPVQEQLAVATAGTDTAKSFAKSGGAWRGGVAVTDGVAMRAVARVVLELTRYVAAQALALAYPGELGR
jgi:hypothetical protein